MVSPKNKTLQLILKKNCAIIIIIIIINIIITIIIFSGERCFMKKKNTGYSSSFKLCQLKLCVCVCVCV